MHPALLSVLAATLIFTRVADAAPDTAQAADTGAPLQRDAQTASDGLPRAEASPGLKTLDLLIDMQPRSAGLQFNERQVSRSGDMKQRQTASAAAATAQALAAKGSAAARAEPPAATASGLFGSEATPLVQVTRTANVEPRIGAAAGSETSATRRDGASPGGEPPPRWLTLPRELIEYVRENRWLVLSSVAGGLLLIWGLSALFSRVAAAAGRPPVASTGGRADHGFSAGRWDPPRQEVRPGRRRSHRRPR